MSAFTGIGADAGAAADTAPSTETQNAAGGGGQAHSAKKADRARPAAAPAPFLMTGAAAGSAFTHPDERFATFRRRVNIHCGDWELKVIAEPATGPTPSLNNWVGGTPWDAFCNRFSRYHQHMRDEDPSSTAAAAAGACVDGNTPAKLLWELTNFGELFWDWKKYPDRDAPKGARFGPSATPRPLGWGRIRVPTSPDAGPAAVDAALEAALAALEAVPADPQGAQPRRPLLPRERVADAIRADCALLRELVAAAGSFGAAALPDGMAQVVACNFVAYPWEDDDRIAVFATKDHFYCIWMATS